MGKQAEFQSMTGKDISGLWKTLADKDAVIAKLTAALRPFADYASLPSFNVLPDDHVMTAGSRMAARQITAKDFKVAKEALK